MGALWHPFSNMSAVEEQGEFTLASGKDCYVFDTEGNRYLDATAGLWFANVGHGRVELAEAAARQIARLASYSIFGDYSNEPAEQLAEKLAGIAPTAGSKVFLTSGGSDSVDTAAKLARRYWVEMGQPERRYLINRQKAYHGMNYAGTALAGLPGNRDGYGELVADTASIPWDSAEELRSTIERIGPERVAAFYCEPVIGAGGVYPPPDGYLADVRKICTEYDVLFVADEVVTGYGRIGGAWFASSKFGLEPDITTTAKGLSSGYLPIGAVLIAPRVAEPFFRPGGDVWWRHGYTYSGHAAAAAVALANLAIIERESLLDEAARLETSIAEALRPLADHERVEEVRCGTGALGAIQLHDPGQAMGLARALRGHGVATRAVGVGGIQVSPPLIMTDEQVGELAAAVRAALDE
jgi:adenosylmethionine-8-amino-7-oxononanoate aminotransferase